MTRLDPLLPSDDGLPWRATGISGIGRQREWDAVQLVELGLDPEFRELDELRLYLFQDGSSCCAGSAPSTLVEALAEQAATMSTPPLEALCIRRSDGAWSIGVRSANVVRLTLTAPPGPSEIGIAVLDGGEPTVTIDGVIVDGVEQGLEDALATIRAHAQKRYRDYAAYAERVGLQDWALSVDPL